MNIHFTPGPYERRLSYGRVPIPQEYLRIIDTLQKNRELSCVTDGGIMRCYPFESFDEIIKFSVEIRALTKGKIQGSEIIEVIDPHLHDLARDFFNAERLQIHPQGLLIPEKNFLRKHKDIIIRGHTGHFTLEGKI